MADAMFWGAHAGKTGDADDLFLKQGYVAIGWAPMGDLSKYDANRDKLKAAIAAKYPEMAAGAIPVVAGQLFRFVHDMQPGHLVIYPSKQDRHVHIGRVEGPYEYATDVSDGYPNLRKVTWLKTISRSAFSPAALFEIGAAMSLFRVREHAAEFAKQLQRESAEPPPAEAEEQVPPIQAAAVEESTEDFVLRRLSQEMKGHPLASFVADLLKTMGFRTRVSPPGIDQGVDVVAHRDELGLEPPLIRVQVKSSPGTVGDPEVSAFSAKVGSNESGLFVTLGTYSPQALTFARGKPQLRLVNGREFVEMVLDHYEDLPPKYKQLIPLRRMYVVADSYEGD